jgi:alkanesulfonate monooxygenase SsuD/methylene tetrahydromethanopterin reductase-like flavin-dependent oxidoreductase (luciferase family)
MLRPMLALYIGGMGAKGRNFYNDLAARYGYETAAADIQELYLSGRKGEAMMKVPAELIDEIALVGPKERIRERLQTWIDSPVTTLNMMIYDVQALRTMVELLAEVSG